MCRIDEGTQKDGWQQNHILPKFMGERFLPSANLSSASFQLESISMGVRDRQSPQLNEIRSPDTTQKEAKNRGREELLAFSAAFQNENLKKRKLCAMDDGEMAEYPPQCVLLHYFIHHQYCVYATSWRNESCFERCTGAARGTGMNRHRWTSPRQ